MSARLIVDNGKNSMAAASSGPGTDRQKALDAALAQIDRAFGKGSAMKLGSREAMQVETISTGSLGLDIALGVGGLPRGRVIEIYGPESSGKTTLALHTIAEAQKGGGTAAFVDAEHALDPVYAKKLGVDIDELIVSQPDTGEQALEIVDTLVRSNAVDILVVDSVAALVPRAEIEGEMGDSHVGLQARLMSQSLRKLTGSISRSRCMVIFINQLRMKIGVMYGNPETTTGGNALKFYASVRLDIRRTGQIKDRDEIVGNATRVKVVKNKVAPPFKQVEFDIMYGEGVSKVGEILDLGVKAGIVEKSGPGSPTTPSGSGRDGRTPRLFLKQNPEIMDRLEQAIRSNGGQGRRGDDGRSVGRRRRRVSTGAEPAVPVGRLNYVELTAADAGVSSAFYAAVFGWRFTPYGPTYAATTADGTNLGLQADEPPAPPLPVVQVDDLEESLRSVQAAGGVIVQPIFAFPGGRRFEFTDPAGNRLAAMQPDG